MSTIYVVIGTCGDGTDRQEWLVMAFTTMASAHLYAAACGAEAKALFGTLRTSMDYRELEGKHTLDSKCQWDCTGVTYDVESVEMDM